LKKSKNTKKYSSIIIVSIDPKTNQKNTQYSDRFRVKLPIINGEPKFQVFNAKGEISIYNKETKVIDWSWAQRGMKIVPIVQNEGLVVVNGKAYNKWRLLALRVAEYNTNVVDNTSFRDDIATMTKKVEDLNVDEEDEDEQ